MRRTVRFRLLLILCGGILLGSALPPTASAAARACGAEWAMSDGRLFRIKATRTTCRTAKQVAGGWYNVQSHGGDARKIYDAKGRRWRCRVTEEATGTDPGYNPYTRVRCTRERKLIRFKLRS